MSPSIDPEILLGFLEEANSYLPAIRSGLASLRNEPSNLEAVEEAHRGVHTIKGAAGMVGLTGLSLLADRFEHLLDQIMQDGRTVDQPVLDTMESAVETIAAYLEATLGETLDEDTLVSGAIERLQVLIGESAGSVEESNESAPAGSLGHDDGSFDDEMPNFASLGLPPFAMPSGLPFETVAPVIPEPQASLSTSSSDVSPELLEVFRLEADDHLRTLTNLLPETKINPADRDQWQEIRRAAHTLKGTAAMVGFAEVTKLAHRMEDLLDQYFEGTRVATAEEIDLLVRSSDAIDDSIQGRTADFPGLHRQLEEALAESGAAVPIAITTAPEPAAAALALPTAIADEPAEEPQPKAQARRKDTNESMVRIPIERLNEIVKLVGELVIARTSFESRLSDFEKVLNELDPSTNRLRRTTSRLEVGFEALALGGATAVGPIGEPFDALEMDRYTEFHIVSRELSETTSDIQTLASELSHVHSDCEGYLTRQARLASELEDKLMRLRMVPLGTHSSKLQRTVRSAADQTRKSAQLLIEGERTGLDKTVLDAMADPLMHLLRNAVDHGLETPEVRRALGKPELGTIKLSASHEGNQVILRIADDGRGIDPHAVRAVAQQRGLIESDHLPTDELYDLLFAPGFSTKKDVSELSGRGVGLDVVKTKVESLKGSIAISSKPGQGTTFTIRLPLTLAITRALLVESNGQTFAIPLDCVEQIQRFDEADVQRIGTDPVLQVGSETVPVSHLGRILNLTDPSREAVKRPPVLILRVEDKRLAVVIDRLIGGREIVVKNLGPHLARMPMITGATLLGDGSVVLILNPRELLRTAAIHTSATFSQLLPRPAPARRKAETSVLLVDDSPSVRRVLMGLMERNGWKSITAKDGVEALELLQRGPVPDIILSDIEMPRMDGYELLGSIRGQATLSRLPVVMITSRSAEKHRQKAMELGASAYLTKPYQDESLLEVIQQLTRSTA